MALSKSVEESLAEAESSLRNALSYAARQERPVVCAVISEMLQRIESMKSMDTFLDMLDKTNRPGDNGFFKIYE